MVYLAGWLVNFAGLAIQALTMYRGRFFLFVTIVVYTCIAFVRGRVGTDTANYERILSGFMPGYEWDGLEPGFVGLGWVLVAAAPTIELAVRAIALIFFSLVAVFAVRSDKNERFLLMAYLLPAFAYQYSMNGLRIGLASAVVLLAVQLQRRCKSSLGLFVGSSAVLLHYSAALSVIAIWASQRAWIRARTFCGVVVAAMLVVSLVVGAQEYFLHKVMLYSAMESPHQLSGLSKLVVILVLSGAIAISRLPRADKTKLVVLTAALALVGWAAARYTYAGIRVLDLVTFAAPLSVLASFSRLGLEFDRYIKVALVICGLMSAIATFRGFLLEAGVGDSPFLPYQLLEF